MTLQHVFTPALRSAYLTIKKKTPPINGHVVPNNKTEKDKRRFLFVVSKMN